jgi:hypothetical protein
MSLYVEGKPLELVAASRMSWEAYDHVRQREGRRGDIDKAYSADIIAMQGRVKTFTHQGQLWTRVCGQYFNGEQTAGCYRLVLLKHYKGVSCTYSERCHNAEDAEAARNDPEGFYNSMRVKSGKDEFVMVGPEVFFKPDPSIPDYTHSDSLFDLPDLEDEDEQDAEDYQICEECGESFEACECDETIEHDTEDVEPVFVAPIASEPEQLGLF